VALESTTVLAPNCTGYNADAPYTLLQRLTLPVFDGDDFSYLDLVTIPSDANGGALLQLLLQGCDTSIA
jgi:hypothetical protein